jgi:hypothetical protein
MQEPARLFWESITKRWGWLVGSVIGGMLSAMNLLGIYPSISWVVGVFIMVVCLLIAAYLAYRDLYMELQIKITKLPSTQTAQLQRRTKLSLSDTMAMADVITRMEKIHGHSDEAGIQSDLEAGYSASDLLSRNCSRCGKQRNEEGDYVSD